MSHDPKKANHDPSDAAPSADYTVGYGRPPLASRWRKGVSGNPKGRPKRTERAWTARQFDTDFLLEANAMKQVRVNGKVESVPMMQLIIRRLLTDAAQGKFRAVREAFKHLQQAYRARAFSNSALFDYLEKMERQAIDISDPVKREEIVYFLNLIREQSRRY